MRIAGDGPKPHFMTEAAVLFRGEAFRFDVVTMDDVFRADLRARLERVGGRLLKSQSWEVTLGLCAGQRVTITQKHTTDAERDLWHADGRPFYYLDVQVAAPRCDDAYGGALGQTYQCKYVQDQEKFVWSADQEEAFRLSGDDGLTASSGAYAADATCDDAAIKSRASGGRRKRKLAQGTGTRRLVGSWAGAAVHGAVVEAAAAE